MLAQLSHFLSSHFPIYSYKISGQSMAPTLVEGDSVLVMRVSYPLWQPVVGELVAVKDPRDGKVLIKRVQKIKDLRYFVQGDNKNHSTDSRVFGMIGKENIVGKVVFRKTGKRIIK